LPADTVATGRAVATARVTSATRPAVRTASRPAYPFVFGATADAVFTAEEATAISIALARFSHLAAADTIDAGHAIAAVSADAAGRQRRRTAREPGSANERTAALLFERAVRSGKPTTMPTVAGSLATITDRIASAGKSDAALAVLTLVEIAAIQVGGTVRLERRATEQVLTEITRTAI
jgi:hypothetical protein